MNNTPLLQTERLILRKFTEEDLEALLVTFRLYQLNLDGNERRVYRKYWDTSRVHFVETDL